MKVDLIDGHINPPEAPTLETESFAKTRAEYADQLTIALCLGGTLVAVHIPSLSTNCIRFTLRFKDQFHKQTFSDIMERTKA